MKQILAREPVRSIGFSETATVVAAVAARLGALRIAKIYGTSLDQLQLVWKAKDGDTPRTIADMSSSEIMCTLFQRYVPDATIYDEEVEVITGQGKKIIYSDPLDGTSSFIREQRYSTTGVAIEDGGTLISSAICSPFERELLVAETGKGAWLFRLNEKLDITGPPKRLEVANRSSLYKGLVYLDGSYYGNGGENGKRKILLMEMLYEASDRYVLFRQTGSNIDQQRQIAANRGDLTLTDTVGGYHDIAAGALMIQEAGGIMLDGQTGCQITKHTQVAIGGNEQLVRSTLPLVQECYQAYNGFR